MLSLVSCFDIEFSGFHTLAVDISMYFITYSLDAFVRSKQAVQRRAFEDISRNPAFTHDGHWVADVQRNKRCIMNPLCPPLKTPH